MKNENKENLKELLERFYSRQEVNEIYSDITETENLLKRYPAPDVDETVTNHIKAEIDEKLAKPAARYTTILLKTAAVAAVLFIVSFVSLSVFTPEPQAFDGTSESTTQIFDNEDLEIAALTAEIEEVEREFSSLSLNDTQTSYYSDITEDLETELIDLDTDFWKG